MIELLQNPSQLEKEEFENEIKFFQKRIKDKNKEITNTLLRGMNIMFLFFIISIIEFLK